MANTFTKIASVTVGSGGASSINFTSIPSTYTDLLVKTSLRRSDSGADSLVVKFNGSSATYAGLYLQGSGSGAASGSGPTDLIYGGLVVGSDATSNTFSNCEMYIPNYLVSINKSFGGESVNENNGSAALARLYSALWSNTSAISSIALTLNSGGNFVQYCTATLYGISKS